MTGTAQDLTPPTKQKERERKTDNALRRGRALRVNYEASSQRNARANALICGRESRAVLLVLLQD